MRKLYGYYRSSAAYRVRIALALKGLDYEYAAIDLLPRVSAHKKPEYLALNPQGRVPFLVDGAVKLSQSPAILEYLDEAYPAHPLLPKAVDERAYVRQLMNIIACDIHPLQNSSVLGALRTDYAADAEGLSRWTGKWIGDGLAAFEAVLAGSKQVGTCCFGDRPTMADVCLVPQLYNARRYDVPLEAYPTLGRIDAACQALEPFKEAAPENQPDAP
ncbi:MAG: maleylacetoacetate isomerase [Kordiimonadaceae bacterium]|nr:maleylacetoacetate isomerase [Kordiimonadaceae bacterium]